MIHFKLLFKRLGIILLLFTICRLLFFLINGEFFTESGLFNWIFIFIHGIRFDISAIVYIHLPFILLHIIPLPQRNSSWYQLSLKYWFHIINAFIIFTNLADIIYFQYTFKRATADIFELIFLGNDFLHLWPQFFSDFWYLVLVYFVLIYRSIVMYRETETSLSNTISSNEKPLLKLLGFMFIILGSIVAGRGGLQLKPIGIINAGAYIDSQNIPLVLNTPFSLITTLGKNGLTELDYYPEDKLNEVYNPVFSPANDQDYMDSNRTNVVIIIMESFSSEYSGFFSENKKTYTPFLDSLAENALAFNTCFANGKKSIEGIPAVLGGLPSLMETPYITSAYAGNRILGIAGHLKKKGYSSSFYHGGNNGTMGFDSYVELSGFDNYFGRDEYNNDDDYDGKWGIFDEEFFQFCASSLETLKKPFVTCIVSLSSHHPYMVPEKYKDKFAEGSLDIHRSVQYADYSLRRFFKALSTTPWFSNTLFVITADHTAMSDNPHFKNIVGMYSIPMIFYHPGSNLEGLNSRVTQQSDIMPSILDYVGYDQNFIAYGTSVFDDAVKPAIAFNYLNGIYQLFEGPYVLQFDGEKSITLYNYKIDPLLENNLVLNEDEKRNAMETKIKGVIQSYNTRLMNNQMVVE
ncbi:MAG TPA: alkaline phosphatase family protein [Flavobacteriales bacterium]|nr:alkaline phosphatase family protein [Flavobacteriales bacterium]HIN39541.1 alkaline phosphatase family protein [Flavobacteriales bacterium]